MKTETLPPSRSLPGSPPKLHASWPKEGGNPAGDYVDHEGERFYRIRHLEQMDPFFMTLISPNDHWLFLSSTGGLAAGRGNAEHALFPYETVDKLHGSTTHTGPVTLLRVLSNYSGLIWEPLAPHTQLRAGTTRTIYKSILGHRILLEETDHQRGWRFRYEWRASNRYGFVRRCELANIGSAVPLEFELLDGLRNLLPSGVTLKLQTQFSCLVDGYKTSERVEDGSLAVYLLASGITDQAVPFESLEATTAWGEGLPNAHVYLEDVAPAFLRGTLPSPASRTRGRRGAYLMHARARLEPGESMSWQQVADVGRTQSQVRVLARELHQPDTLARELREDLERDRKHLAQILGAADGFQACAHEHVSAHHTSNVLYNVMRGGYFPEGYRIQAEEFRSFVARFNRSVAEQHADWLRQLDEAVELAELHRMARELGDPHLIRLVHEFLPLSFSRRHGDPSRPWNVFNIRLRDEQGRPLKAYEGNWRDIFQNWEALATSYPCFLPHFIAKFLNASTADGYNPYRVTHNGIDWEVPDPESPWSSVGYWGDHQIIYLLRLLEMAQGNDPELLADYLQRDLFTCAAVPYRIAPYAEILQHPRETITFDEDWHRRLEAQAVQLGADGKLMMDANGQPLLVNMTEKLLTPLLVKLSNFIPDAGIWMNTQRPEWNDANNALVGYGVSVVTLAYLHRYAGFLRELVRELPEEGVPVSRPVLKLLNRIQTSLQQHLPMLGANGLSPEDRRRLMDELSLAGQKHRDEIYADGLPERDRIQPADITTFLELATRWIRSSLKNNRTESGLYHAYNLIEYQPDGDAVHLRRLPAMLEGQVAILSSGVLSAEDALQLLRALRESPLYRQDQHSYLLYPDRQLPGFLERNIIPPDRLDHSPLLANLVREKEASLVQVDATGEARFHPDIINDGALRQALDDLVARNGWQECTHLDEGRIFEVYEEVFKHRAFTGRSSSMFSYEGLGCIYWHMVAKLLLAVQETWERARQDGESEARCQELAMAYYDIRSGLGFEKTPVEFGAFPADPYSHTPGHSGAQQPGMTGQVKEEILTRRGELGWKLRNGALHFEPHLLRADEFLGESASFSYIRQDGNESSIPLQPGQLAATCCQVPIIYDLTMDAGRTLVMHTDGHVEENQAAGLTPSQTQALFSRDGSIREVRVGIDAHDLLPALA